MALAASDCVTTEHESKRAGPAVGLGEAAEVAGAPVLPAPLVVPTEDVVEDVADGEDPHAAARTAVSSAATTPTAVRLSIGSRPFGSLDLLG